MSGKCRSHESRGKIRWVKNVREARHEEWKIREEVPNKCHWVPAARQQEMGEL